MIGVLQLAQLNTLRGGAHGSTCTGGFTVRASSGELGISTAGPYVCKYGKTTGRTCGYIQSKSYSISYITNSASTFIRVDGYQLAAGGDSGGPWYVEQLAYGIQSGIPGGDSNDALYMAINYISSLGVSVLTSDPGVCNLRPNAWFSYTVSGHWVDFDASGSSDPDGTIVSYYWNFGDGSTATTTSPYISHYYSTIDSYKAGLTVTDSDGGTDTQYGFVAMCGTRSCDN